MPANLQELKSLVPLLGRLSEAHSLCANLNLDGIIVGISGDWEEVLGYSSAELLNHTLAEFAHPSEITRVESEVKGIIYAEEVRTLGFSFLAKDGTYHDLGWKAYASKQENTIYCVVEDKTQTHQTLDSLQNIVKGIAREREHYQLLAENAADVIWQLDNDGRMVWSSSSFSSIFGYTNEQVTGHIAAEFFHPEDRDMLLSRQKAVFAFDTPDTLELRICTASGDYKWVSVRVKRVDRPDKKFTGYLVSLHDITEQVLAQQALMSSEGRYHLVTQNTTDVILLTNPENNITWASPATLSAWGYTPEELVGMSINNLLSSEDVGTLKRAKEQLLEEQRVTCFDLRMRLKNNKWLWCSVALGQLPNVDGALVGNTVTFRDISGQVQIREELAQSKEHYQLLAENVTDVVWQIDLNGLLAWVSPSTKTILGYTPEQLLHNNPSELIHPADEDLLTAARGALLQGITTPDFEVRLRMGDSSYRWFSVRVRDTSKDGMITGVVVGLRDVNKQVTAQEKITQSEKMFRLALNGAPQGMAVVGLHLSFLQVNAALCKILGYSEEWLLSHTLRDVIHPDDLEEDLTGRDALLSGESDSKIRQCRWVRADGTTVWVLHSVGLLRDDTHMPLFYISHVQDNTEEHKNKIELTQLVMSDPVNTVLNRDQIQEKIKGVFGYKPRQSGTVGLLFCDLDYFKKINDKYGHLQGDEILKILAGRIQKVLRTDDITVRTGGGKFVITLPSVTDLKAAIGVADKVRQTISEPLQIDGDSISITASVGISLGGSGMEAHTLLSNAEAAVYQAKHDGRDRAAVFSNKQTFSISKWN